MEYRPGKEGGKPDALTRGPMYLPAQDDERTTQMKLVLLQQHYFEDTKIEVIELSSWHNKNEDEIRQTYRKDTQIQKIKKALEKGQKEMKGVALGLWQWKEEHLWYEGKIWIPEEESLWTSLISQCHDNALAGHRGTAKTKELVSRQYYWPKMRETIKQYVKNCDTCQCSKAVQHAPYRLLLPNEVPEQPWRSITMDLITDLPKSDEYDAIVVVIDCQTKMSPLIPCKKDLEPWQFATLFMQNIVRLHGIPRDIITDRGSLFNSRLWKQISEKLAIERRLSTAYHPQTDSQTKRTNIILEQYLPAYISHQHDNWNEYLPLAELAYNNEYQETIKTTSLYANYGRNPEPQLINHMITEKETSAGDIEQLDEKLREEMKTAELRQKGNFNGHRKPDPNLKSEDMVWFLPQNVKTTRLSKKLDYKKIGPLKIIKQVGTGSYKLDLPVSITIHNIFHISFLEPYEDNKFRSQMQTPPPSIVIDREPECELEEIINSRLHWGKLEYCAKWTGYSPEHYRTWYPAENFSNARIAFEQFYSQYPGKPWLGTRDYHQVQPANLAPSRARKPQNRRQLPPKTDGMTTGSLLTTLPLLAHHTPGWWK